MYFSLLSTGLHLPSLIRLFHYRKRHFVSQLSFNDDSVTLFPWKFSGEHNFVTLSIDHFSLSGENTGSIAIAHNTTTNASQFIGSNPERLFDYALQFERNNSRVTWIDNNGTDLRQSLGTLRSTADGSLPLSNG